MKVFALHKPTGITCDLSVRSTARGRRHADLNAWFQTLVPGLRHVGRLDKPTTGLLLAIAPGKDEDGCAGAGKLTRKLLDPGVCTKIYVARVKCGTSSSSSSSSAFSCSPVASSSSMPAANAHRQPTSEHIAQLLDGVMLPDGVSRFDSVQIVCRHERTFTKNDVTYTTHETELRLAIRIGRNRIVRRTLAAVGLPVVCLTRIAIGRLRLEDLPIPLPFDSVQLTADHIKLLLERPGDAGFTKTSAKRG
jgi:16S rRNA U516 pseudouridylate synthase RsuA-like enzyme